MNEKMFNRLIILLSIVIPVAVALLFRIKVEGYDLTFLPPIYATVNGLTAILLVMAVVSIKRGKRVVHERLMKSSLVLSASFLVMYVLYHITSDSTTYGNESWVKYVYYFILISHILLSIAVVPLVLFSYSRAVLRNFERHKKLARITFPIWLYVAISGVIVYIMISPYYG